MQINPYLVFNGQCEAAFKFYEKCLGGKIEAIFTFGQSPMADQVPAEW
jgi:PhnB protein